MRQAGWSMRWAKLHGVCHAEDQAHLVAVDRLDGQQRYHSQPAVFSRPGGMARRAGVQIGLARDGKARGPAHQVGDRQHAAGADALCQVPTQAFDVIHAFLALFRIGMRKQAQVVRVGSRDASRRSKRRGEPSVLNPALDLRGLVKAWARPPGPSAIETDGRHALDDLLERGRPKGPSC